MWRQRKQRHLGVAAAVAWNGIGGGILADVCSEGSWVRHIENWRRRHRHRHQLMAAKAAASAAKAGGGEPANEGIMKWAYRRHGEESEKYGVSANARRSAAKSSKHLRHRKSASYLEGGGGVSANKRRKRAAAENARRLGKSCSRIRCAFSLPHGALHAGRIYQRSLSCRAVAASLRGSVADGCTVLCCTAASSAHCARTPSSFAQRTSRLCGATRMLRAPCAARAIAISRVRCQKRRSGGGKTGGHRRQDGRRGQDGSARRQNQRIAAGQRQHISARVSNSLAATRQHRASSRWQQRLSISRDGVAKQHWRQWQQRLLH